MFIRKFIIMSKQTLKDVKGHVKLEVRGSKGKVSLSVEGVRPKDDKSHKLYAVTDEKHGFKEVSLGVVDVNKNGRGKLDVTFNPKSVNKSKIDIEGFNILVLKEESLLEGESNVILGGYIHTEDGTIGKLKKETKTSKKGKVEKKEDKQVEEILKEKHLEDHKDEKEKIEELVKEDLRALKTKVYVKEKDRQEKKELESNCKVETETKLKECEKFKADDDSFENYNEQLASYTLDLLKFFKKVKPFKEKAQNERFNWWEIDDDKLNNGEGFLPYYKYISDPPHLGKLTETDVTCKDQIDKYNKYLFGVSESEGKITHYIYGIPGRHERNEHPYGGKTGFVTWLQDKSNTRNGYWLIYIDAHTGNVVRPI